MCRTNMYTWLTCALRAYIGRARVVHPAERRRKSEREREEVIITGSIRVYCIRACNLPRVRFRLADNAARSGTCESFDSLRRRRRCATLSHRAIILSRSTKAPVRFDLQIPIDRQ